MSGLGEAIGAHLADMDEELSWALEAIQDLSTAVTKLTEEVIKLQKPKRRTRRK